MKPLVGAVTLIAAVAAVLTAAALLHTPNFQPADAGPLIARTIRINLFDGRGPLHAGDQIPSNEAVGVNFVNPRLDGLQLVLYALDSQGGTHWIVPYQRPGGKRDWSSKGVPTSFGEANILPPASLGGLPEGPLTFIAIVNPGPILLERLDTFAPEEHTVDGLKGRFPDAVILSWPVTVVAG